MTTINDLEKNKFCFQDGKVCTKAVEGGGPTTVFLTSEIDELEYKKFTSNGEIRISVSF